MAAVGCSCCGAYPAECLGGLECRGNELATLSSSMIPIFRASSADSSDTSPAVSFVKLNADTSIHKTMEYAGPLRYVGPPPAQRYRAPDGRTPAARCRHEYDELLPGLSERDQQNLPQHPHVQQQQQLLGGLTLSQAMAFGISVDMSQTANDTSGAIYLHTSAISAQARRRRANCLLLTCLIRTRAMAESTDPVNSLRMNFQPC
ncbi:hypothetical protein BIW11_04047 [Tropilaelaps mercedesae]|uniref:Uncharacterized protein n=1 Tax=Tropilaelaps mercedesae TaxID=418985 RepID=A0A1V9XCC7_9ACAR|nr:hypothetical protein BIW11_04047 [Tropilaelaps mercedesae]